MAFLNVAVMEAQNIICKVVDAKTQEAIVGAVVTQKSSKKVLAITDIDCLPLMKEILSSSLMWGTSH